MNRVAVLLFCLILCVSEPVFAGENKAGKNKTEENTVLEELLRQIDFDEVDTYLKQKNVLPIEEQSFSDLVVTLIQRDGIVFHPELVLQGGKDMLCQEIEANKKILLEVVLLALVFSVLKNFAGAFGSSYVSELCFILVYCVLAILLTQSFLTCSEIVSQTLKQSISFMKVMIPTYCIAMVFAAGSSSSIGFYQIAFLVIYLVQWLFLYLFIPMIHLYILVMLFHHFFEEEKFANLTELLKGIILWGLKLSGMVVLGLNIVQGFLNPVKDRLLNGTVEKAASMIPCIGNVADGVTELLLGSGILIKNGVGVAALLILVLLCAVPMGKIACITLFYKIAAAVTEPVADKRIAGCLKGMAEGGVLYVKLMGYCVVLFFLTIALTTMLTGTTI